MKVPYVNFVQVSYHTVHDIFQIQIGLPCKKKKQQGSKGPIAFN